MEIRNEPGFDGVAVVRVEEEQVEPLAGLSHSEYRSVDLAVRRLTALVTVLRLDCPVPARPPPLRQVLRLADIHHVVVRGQHVHPALMWRIGDDEATERSGAMGIQCCCGGLGISSLRHELQHRACLGPNRIDRCHAHEVPLAELALEH